MKYIMLSLFISISFLIQGQEFKIKEIPYEYQENPSQINIDTFFIENAITITTISRTTDSFLVNFQCFDALDYTVISNYSFHLKMHVDAELHELKTVLYEERILFFSKAISRTKKSSISSLLKDNILLFYEVHEYDLEGNLVQKKIIKDYQIEASINSSRPRYFVESTMLLSTKLLLSENNEYFALTYNPSLLNSSKNKIQWQLFDLDFQKIKSNENLGTNIGAIYSVLNNGNLLTLKSSYHEKKKETPLDLRESENDFSLSYFISILDINSLKDRTVLKLNFKMDNNFPRLALNFNAYTGKGQAFITAYNGYLIKYAQVVDFDYNKEDSIDVELTSFSKETLKDITSITAKLPNNSLYQMSSAYHPYYYFDILRIGKIDGRYFIIQDRTEKNSYAVQTIYNSNHHHISIASSKEGYKMASVYSHIYTFNKKGQYSSCRVVPKTQVINEMPSSAYRVNSNSINSMVKVPTNSKNIYGMLGGLYFTDSKNNYVFWNDDSTIYKKEKKKFKKMYEGKNATLVYFSTDNPAQPNKKIYDGLQGYTLLPGVTHHYLNQKTVLVFVLHNGIRKLIELELKEE